MHDKNALLNIPVPASPIISTPQDCVPSRLADSTLADDVVLLTIIPRSIGPDLIISWIQDIVSCVDASFARFGYQLNYLEGKPASLYRPKA